MRFRQESRPHLEMSEWHTASGFFIFLNLLLVGGSSYSVYYGLSILLNTSSEEVYTLNTQVFYSVIYHALFAYSSLFLLTSLLGVIIGAITASLNSTRKRSQVNRISCDTAFDVCLTFHVFLLLCCFVASGIVAAVLTYYHITSNTLDVACPNEFQFTEGPSFECAFDFTSFLVVNGAVSSNQLSNIWIRVQEELHCCGYWCPEGNTSGDCSKNVENIWQMQYCAMGASLPSCREPILDLARNYTFIPMCISWGVFAMTILMMAFVCQLRIHITNNLKAWLSKK
jgi:hypothetical protein